MFKTTAQFLVALVLLVFSETRINDFATFVYLDNLKIKH